MGTVIATLAATVALAGAAPQTNHVIRRDPDTSRPTTAADTAARLVAIAEDVRSKGQSAPRIAIYDVAWPRTLPEYEAVGRNGILQVTVVVADRAELPVRSVYLHTHAGDAILKALAAVNSIAPVGSPIRGVGLFRQDSYYLLPITLARQPGAILVDFAQHRAGFQLDSLPLGPPAYADDASDPRPIDRRAVNDFLTREFLEAPDLAGGS